MANKKLPLNVLPRKIQTRCSSLPLLFSCKFGVTNPDKLTEVEIERPAAALGTDIHAAIQKAAETGEINFNKIERMYKGEDVERAKELFTNGMAVVQEAAKSMKNMQFEVEVGFESERYAVSGHVDILDADSSRAFVVDFKTGRVHQDHTHQMVGYAVGAWSKVGRPDAYEVHVAYVYLDGGEVTRFTITADDMKEWLKELDSLPDRYTVSNRCVYCKINNTCPAFRDYLKGSMELLTGLTKLPAVHVRKLALPQRAKLAAAVKMAKTAAERVRDYVKEDAIRGGDIDNGDGTSYTIKRRKYRMLLTSKALPILAKYVTAKDVMNATKLSLNDLIAAATRRVLGPMRKTIAAELTKRLEDAGAIVVSEAAYLETIANKSENKWQTKKKSNMKSPLPPKATPSRVLRSNTRNH